jgi:hypothetical protein
MATKKSELFSISASGGIHFPDASLKDNHFACRK